jgi:hypothetical protein
MAARAASRLLDLNDSTTVAEPMPTAVYRRLLRQLLLHFVSDTVKYFFRVQSNGVAVRQEIQQKLRHTLVEVKGPLVVISHDLGALIAYDVLSDRHLPEIDVRLLITLGSPLGYAEILLPDQPALTKPKPVQQWYNFVDPVDAIALDADLAENFRWASTVENTQIDNRSPNHHAACGYLGATQVRSTVAAHLPGEEPLAGEAKEPLAGRPRSRWRRRQKQRLKSGGRRCLNT